MPANCSELQPATLAHKNKKMGIKNPPEETEYHYSVIHMK